MVKKMFAGLGFLVVIFIAFMVYTHFDSVKHKNEMNEFKAFRKSLQQVLEADVKPEVETGNIVFSTQKPDDIPGYKWVRHGDHWDKVPVSLMDIADPHLHSSDSDEVRAEEERVRKAIARENEYQQAEAEKDKKIAKAHEKNKDKYNLMLKGYDVNIKLRNFIHRSADLQKELDAGNKVSRGELDNLQKEKQQIDQLLVEYNKLKETFDEKYGNNN